MSEMVVKLKDIMLNDTPKCRSEEARECGSEKWKARKARKVVNAGNAELGARMSGMIAKLKSVMLNKAPKYRSGLSKMVLLQCRPCRTGIGIPLAEREHYTGNVLHTMCPECPE